jgi:hypothetical protein
MNKKRSFFAGLVPAAFILIFFSLFFISCTTEVTLAVQADNSVKINFEGGAGEAFTRMISSASGVSGAAAGDTLIDADSLSYELAKAGFADVKVNQKKGGSVLISMSDKNQSSYIFTSGIIKTEKGKLSAQIKRKSLEDFYNTADEQTRATLDLFLAPVFNNEYMSEEEYLEMLASFYGEAAAKEVSESFVKINLISKDGSKQTLTYPMSQIFCGNF